ncbi:active regulator of SIRT1-like [Carcharodon carcharias]|uniref:active regulator of SIRT1-like n=1 Tax=Carcharodon carcharias TaxID=13397 RepID=UPI001B7EEE78|nr:active regulator of SIRT1-like [Carcharodon carcharias]
MSATLIRKGLDFMSGDVRVSGKGKGRKKAIPGHSSGADRLRLVNTNKKGIKKQLERIQGQGKKMNKATVKGKVVKSALEEYWKKRAADHTEENLRYMLGSKFLTEGSVTQKVLMYSQGRKAKDRPEKKEVKKEEKSIFTESEFRNFEKEYFGMP